MKIELRYFTGTGNAWKVLDACKEVFIDAGHQANISKLDPNEHFLKADLIGFSFPVYAFGMPKIVLRYLRSLKAFDKAQDVFFLVTPGDVSGASTTTKKCENILRRKNCQLVYSDILAMPNNWIPFTRTASPEVNKTKVENGVTRAQNISQDILEGKKQLFDLKRIPVSMKILGSINIMFRTVGLGSMRKMFRTYPSCDGCGLCEKACPTHSIKIVNGKPKWLKSCEQCMRCVHVCPKEAIYQRPASTKGKDRYFAPGFKPLSM